MHLTLPLLLFLPLTLSIPTADHPCPEPTTFRIDSFTTFIADIFEAGFVGTSFISFLATDSVTNTTTTFVRDLAPAGGASPADPNNFYVCTDDKVKYLWNGTALTVKESYENCHGHERTASGTEIIPLNCYNALLGGPYGQGVECKTLGGVSFVNVTSVI